MDTVNAVLDFDKSKSINIVANVNTHDYKSWSKISNLPNFDFLPINNNITTINHSFGIVYNDLLITNYHSVQNASSYFADNKIITKICDYPVFDLSIFKLSEKYPSYTVNDLQLSLNGISSKSVLINNTVSTITNVKCDYLYTKLMPPVPVINIISKDLDNLHGLSGKPVFLDKKIIGIISNYNNNTKQLQIIPSYIINYAYNLAMSDQKDIKNIFLQTSIHKFSTTDNKDTKKDAICHYIRNTYELKYTIKKKKLDNNIMIETVNNKSFESNGDIILHETQIPVNLRTYLLFNNNISVKFTGYFINQKTNNAEPITFNLDPILLTDISKLSIHDNKQYFVINNLVFTELNEEIVKKMFEKTDFTLVGPVVDIYNHPYDTIKEQNKPIILFDILYSHLDKHTSKLYQQIGFPLIRTENSNNCIIPILTHINKKKIKNLQHLANIIQAKNKSPYILQFAPHMSSHETIKIKFTNKYVDVI
jgi:hypothetical protein